MAEDQTACQYKGNFREHFLRHEVDQEVGVESTPNGASGGDSARKKKQEKPRLSLGTFTVNTLKAPGVAPQDVTKERDNVSEDPKDSDEIRHIDSVLECSPVDVECNGGLCESRRSPRKESVDDEITCDCAPMPTTVFKKQSPNSRLTLYLSSREFVHLSNGKVSSIDGVVLVETSYVQNRRVYAMVVLTFRYGREDEEVMGLKFYTEAVLDYRQVYPEATSDQTQSEELTPLQINLMRKLGADAYPFTLRVSPKAPPSVRLHPARPYVGSPLGVSYDLKVFIADKDDDKPHKRNLVRMALRTVQYAEEIIRNPCNRPSINITKHFVLSSGKLQIQAILDKELYQQGDPLHVHIIIDNSTRTKTVHRLKVSVLQHVNVCMFTHGRFKNIIGTGDSSEGGAGTSSVSPMSRAQRDFVVVLDKCEKFPVALAVESDISHDDPSQYNLSSSTALIDPKEKNPYGVSVQYEVKIKALLGCLDRPIIVKIPFKVMAIKKDDFSTRSTVHPDIHSCDSSQRDRKLSQQFPYALLNSAEFVTQELHAQRASNTSPSPPQSAHTSRPSIVVIEEQRVRNPESSQEK